MTKRLFSSVPSLPSLLCLALSLVVTNARAAQIDTAELFRSVTELRAEIEQIRVVMGEPLPPSREYRVDGAVPRHVYYQAQTLFRKSNLFAQQIAGVSRQPSRPAPEGSIASEDVLLVLNDTREQLGHVRTALDIAEAVAEAKADRRKQPSDILYELIEAGRDINFISGRTVAWTTVYDRLLLAISYVGGALPEAGRFPALPAFEPGKFPQDVVGRLQRCMELSRKLAGEYDVSMVRLEVIRRSAIGPTVIEVLDVATILLSDLAELTYLMEAEELPLPEYPRPSRIFPSHVNQLAGVLEAQLEALTGT